MVSVMRNGAWRPLLILMTFTLVLCLAGCGSEGDDDDDNTPTGPDPGETTSLIPRPTGPEDILPDYTAYEAEEAVSVNKFEPCMTGASSFFDAYNGVPIYTFRLKQEKVTLWETGRPISDPDFDIEYSKDGGTTWRTMSVEERSNKVFFTLMSYGNHTYLFTMQKVKWPVALGLANQLGGYLVVIDDQAENTAIDALMETLNIGDAWLGLNDYDSEGSWVWANGSSATFRNWDSGEPNNDNDNEHFALIKSNGKWNDEDDGCEYHAIIEFNQPMSDPPTVPQATRQYGFDGTRFPLFGDLAISREPYLARAHLWRKVFQHTVEYPGTYSQAHSVSRGLSETSGTEFCLSVGITLSYTYGGFTGEFNTTFSSTFSRSVTVTKDTTVTKVYSTESIEGKAIHLSVWQQVEQFLITDEDGVRWADPRYDVGEIGIENGLSNEYQRTVAFDL